MESPVCDYYNGGLSGAGAGGANAAAGSSSAAGHYSSSNRSVSSRSWASRSGFSRFLSGGAGNGGTNSSNNSHVDPRDFDAHRTLIPGKKIKVLTWGKKKDVKIPLDRFVAVRKGKTTDRTKRNNCPASRILSLITADEAHHSHIMTTTLDIEAPTKLDRDKFARAFARFLNIPLVESDQYHHMTNVDMRSVRSDMTPTSIQKGKDRVLKMESKVSLARAYKYFSPAHNSFPRPSCAADLTACFGDWLFA
jgi:hypothetical protein